MTPKEDADQLSRVERRRAKGAEKRREDGWKGGRADLLCLARVTSVWHCGRGEPSSSRLESWLVVPSNATETPGGPACGPLGNPVGPF